MGMATGADTNEDRIFGPRHDAPGASRAVILPDPELCPECSERGRVYDSRNDGRGYRHRRHVCVSGHRWQSWQTVLPPHEQNKLARTSLVSPLHVVTRPE